MADTPEDRSTQPWSRSAYLRRKAEREADEPASEQGQSGLQKIAEQIAHERHSATDVFKQVTEASLEQARAAGAAWRTRQKADMEEAFTNALTKSKTDNQWTTSSSASNSILDDIQKILDAPDLWDANQSGIDLQQSYSARRWSQAKNSIGPREIAGMIAAASAPLVFGFIAGSVLNIWNGLLVAGITLLIELLILACLYFWVVPKEMDKVLSGDLAAARNQIKENRNKLERLAAIAQRRKQSHLEAEANLRATESQLNTVREQLQEARDEIALLNERPKLSGTVHDLDTGYYFDKTTLESQFPRPLGRQFIISLSLTNEHRTPTTVHNFGLKWEALGKAWVAPHAEEITKHKDRDVWATSEQAKENENKVNLVSYLGDPTKKITQDVRIEGYLVFRIPGFGVEPGSRPEDMPAEGWSVNLTLFVEDKWRTKHPIDVIESARPSLRLSKTSRF